MSLQISNLPAPVRRTVKKLPSVTQDVVKQRLKSDKPVLVYEEAVKALAECRSIDEAKYFSDKADALAAYAKIFKDTKLKNEAQRVKLHSLRRMGEIAEQLRPTGRNSNTKRGRIKGAHSLLVESGLAKGHAATALRLSRVSTKIFDEAVQLPAPPGATTLAKKGRGRSPISSGATSDAYLLLSGNNGNVGLRPAALLSRRADLKELARSVSLDEAKKLRELMLEIHEGMDLLDQYMPSERRS